MAELRVKRFRMVRKVSLGDAPLSIGRSSRNDVVLASRTVSRQHAVIEVVDGSPRIRDLGSSHGTRVNGRRVTESLLYDEDAIGIGRFELVFTNAGGPKRPETAAAEIQTLAVDLDAIVPVPVREQAEADAVAATAAAVAALEARQAEVAAARSALEEARAALQVRERELESLAAELEARAGTVELREAAVAAADCAMEAERAAWGDERAQLAREMQELRDAQSQLEAARSGAEQQREELQAAVASVRSELAQLTLGHDAALEAREAAERHAADAVAARESLSSALLEKDAAIAAHIRRHEADANRMDALTAEARRHAESRDALRDELHNAQSAMQETARRIAELESELESRRQDAERAQRDLFRKNRELQRKVEELERVSDAAETMEHQLHETQVMRAIAHERSNVAVRVLQQFESGSQTLQQASKRLAKIMRVIEQLEAQWVECDERMQEVEQLGPAAVDAAVAERDQLAAQLEDANAARDDAIAKLLAQTEQISAVGVSVPEAQALRMPAPAKSWRSRAARRPWWRFGL